MVEKIEVAVELVAGVDLEVEEVVNLDEVAEVVELQIEEVDVVVEEVVGVEVEEVVDIEVEEVVVRRSFGRALTRLAACLLFGVVLWGAYEMMRAGDGAGEVEVVELEGSIVEEAEAVVVTEEEKRSPEDEYRMKMLAVVGTGSMDRPPTGFEAVTAAGPVDFNRDIRPILSENCFHCHGPDKETREADFRLDVEAAAKADLGGYHGLVPGDVEASEVYYRVITDDEDDLMPPRKAKRELTARQKELLKQWIEEGAVYADHWAYVGPARGEVPEGKESALPACLLPGLCTAPVYRRRRPADQRADRAVRRKQCVCGRQSGCFRGVPRGRDCP